MDQKEVELRGKAIAKAFTEKQPSSTMLSLLSELRKGVRASEDLLRSTRIGVTVNKLKQHPDPSVAGAANELVKKWKSDMRGGSSANAGAATPKSTNGTASPAPAAAPTPPPAAAAGKPKAKHTVAPETRNHKTDKVEWQVTGSAIRDNCVKLMYDGLAHMSEERECAPFREFRRLPAACLASVLTTLPAVPEEIIRLARVVEVAAFEKYRPETSDAYKSKMRSLYQNLKNKSNPQLRRRVIAGDISPKRFVIMTHDELKSAEMRKQDEALERENMREAMTAQEEKSVSTSLKCGKCQQKKVSYSQAQTRSADEPMTTFCECLNCGNRWKFS